jgi:polysaccharide pyruvyl transferase WcaK-like protein
MGGSVNCMKKIIRTAFDTIINGISRLVYLLAGSQKSKRVLIVAPSWEGSLGDEAVIDALSHALKENGYSVTLVHWDNQNAWNGLQAIHDKISAPAYFKSGGWSERIKFIFRFPRYSRFYLLGTDMLDGCYAEWLTLGLLRLTRQAAITGLETTLVGFSINTWQRPSCIKMLKEMPSRARLCVRDDVSLARLEQLTGRNDLILTADIAFLLPPTPQGPFALEAINWINQQKQKGHIVAGVNINPQLFEGFEQSSSQISKLFADALAKVSAEHNHQISFFLLPHDFRPNNSDVQLLNGTLDALPQPVRDNTYIIAQKPRASEIKAIAGTFDIVMTGRMHVAIATLGQGTPLGCLVYQGKFEGLFNHFQLHDQYKADPKIITDPQATAAFLARLIGDRAIIRQKVAERLSTVKQFSRTNLG